MFLAAFSRCKEDNEDRRHHNITSLVINNKPVSKKTNTVNKTFWLCLDQLPLDVGGQMDRWGDMIYCITDNSLWSSPLSSLQTHSPQPIDSKKLSDFKEVRQMSKKTNKIQNTFFQSIFLEPGNTWICFCGCFSYRFLIKYIRSSIPELLN